MNYRLRGNDYVRDSLNVYWEWRATPSDEPERIHTIIRAIEREVGPENDGERTARREHGHTKVYVPAHISEAALCHVLGRIPTALRAEHPEQGMLIIGLRTP
ncbi:MAG: hypothetical protein R2708_23480 [Vicinamibacterales bacterium]